MGDDVTYIHPKAEVHDDCEIGEGTTIWQFASVIRGAKIGRQVNIASGTTIDGSEIGDGTVLGHCIAMGPGFVIGKNCFLGPGVVLCNDAWPRAGKSNFDLSAYKDCPAIVIEDGASVGANSVIMAGVRIGKMAMIAAGSVVRCDVPPRTLYMNDGSMQEIVNESAKKRIRHASDVAIKELFL